MSLSLDKSSWKRVALRDVVRHITDRVDPETSGLERFLAGEHIPSGNLAITNWGVIGEDPIGPMFYKRFKPGHVLYVSRRTYLRKVAVPEFEGITGEKTFVLEAVDSNVLLQEFLPFVLSAERFHAYAVANSRGSVNPYLNWGELAAYEFALPPLDEQKRIADLLWAVEREARRLSALRSAAGAVRQIWLDDRVAALTARKVVPFSVVWSRSPESGWSVAPPGEDTGRYVLSLSALGAEGYRTGHLKNVPDTAEARAAALRCGDLLISRANTVDAVGRAGIYSEDRADVSFPDTMMRVSLVDDVDPRFAEVVIASRHGRMHMRRSAAGSATSMVKINRSSLGRLPFPYVQRDEQEALLSHLVTLTGAVEQVESQLAALEGLRAPLLAEVFGGK